MPKSKFQLDRRPTQRKQGSRSSKRSSNSVRSSSLQFSRRSPIQPSLSSKQSIVRLFLVWGVLVLATLGLGARLYYLQIIDPVVVYEQAPKGKKLTQIAADQQTTRLNFYIPRRQIVDRQQNVLATDRITYTLYVHPYLFRRNSQPVPAEEIAGKSISYFKQFVVPKRSAENF